ncbi:MAG: hypothetical protein KC619_12260 [Myxococcales bacterium]|nr:hypothetical protein [Myxococcales bacterium]
MTRFVLGAVLAMTAASCVGPGEPVFVEPLDVAFYEASVEPVVHWSCASLECHGQDGRPLRIYSVDGLRMSDALRGRPLSPAEAEWNAFAFAGVDPMAASVDESVVLEKPLSVDAGGLHHEGDDLWPDRSDPSYLCLRGWLAGDPSAAADCDRAAAMVVPPE